MIQRIVVVLGLLALSTVLLYPVWTVTYVNTAGLDKWSRVEGGKPTQEELWSTVTTSTVPKRALMFTGPHSRQFNEIQRNITDLMTNRNETVEQPWQFVHVTRASVNVPRLLTECATILVVGCLVLALHLIAFKRHGKT